MSVYVMSWVWANGPANPTERLVLLAIADHADDQGGAFPSMAGIAAKACLTERGARGVVRRLESGGWLETEVGGGRGGKSLYRVTMRANPERPSAFTDENPEQETRNNVPGKAKNPERDDINPERDCTKPGTAVPPNHHRTIIEPSGRAKRATKKRSQLSQHWCLPKSWGEWAVEKGLTASQVRHEAEQFANHHRAKGSLMADWQAAWRTWVNNAIKWAAERPASKQTSPRRKRHWELMKEREDHERTVVNLQARRTA